MRSSPIDSISNTKIYTWKGKGWYIYKTNQHSACLKCILCNTEMNSIGCLYKYTVHAIKYM